MTKTDLIELKQKRIDEMRKTVMISHRQELIDQNSAYPPHVVVTVDHAESPVKRWQACMDARVRPEHMAHTATPELIGNDRRQYQVFPRGKKFVTRVYLHGMWAGTMYSKRRKTAIRKGKEWIGE